MRVSPGSVPTRRAESYREGMFLCRVMQPVEVLGISYEGQERIRSCGHAEGVEGKRRGPISSQYLAPDPERRTVTTGMPDTLTKKGEVT